MQSFVIDAALVFAAFLIAIFFLWGGYHRGHYAWAVKHALIFRAGDRRGYWTGFTGEAVLCGFAAIAACVVIFFTADATLAGVLERWWWVIPPILLFVWYFIQRHSKGVVDKTAKAGRTPWYVGQVRAAYRLYDFYSVSLFGMGAFIILVLLAQFLHDGAAFALDAQAIEASFSAARRVAEGGTAQAYGQAMAQAEIGFSQVALSHKLLQIQFNPLFIFAGTLITINILIRFSPLKGLFTGDALNMTAVFTYGPLVLIGLAGLLVYLNVYEVMLERALVHLQAFTPPPALGDWEMAERHGQMVTELSNARNIFGFGQAIGGEGGGFAILAWGVQTALEKIADNDKDEKPPRMPLKRWRPDDGRDLEDNTHRGDRP